jgi:hypothetical protein
VDDAPAHYKAKMQKAKQRRRGLWSASAAIHTQEAGSPKTFLLMMLRWISLLPP